MGPLPVVDGCRKGVSITVSKKQNWAKFTWGGQEDAHHRKLCQSSSHTPQGPNDLEELLLPEAPPQLDLVAVGSKETAEALISYTETCSSSFSAKCSSQGAYLQSLERSSRHWVLSSGKAQGVEELAAGSGTEPRDPGGLCSSEGEIWYNPIPEDEDPQLHAIEKRWGSSTGKKELRSWKWKPRETEAAHGCPHLGGSQQAGSDGLYVSPNQARAAKQTEELNTHQHQACGETSFFLSDFPSLIALPSFLPVEGSSPFPGPSQWCCILPLVPMALILSRPQYIPGQLWAQPGPGPWEHVVYSQCCMYPTAVGQQRLTQISAFLREPGICSPVQGAIHGSSSWSPYGLAQGCS